VSKSKLAFASLVCGVLGIVPIFALAGLGFGLAAIARIKEMGRAGKGFAIAGVGFSIAWLFLFFYLDGIGALKDILAAKGGVVGCIGFTH